MRAIAICFVTSCFLICLFLGGMWNRSYRHADRLHGRLSGMESFLIASKQGAVAFLWFTSHGNDNWWQWEIRNYSTSDEMSFPVGDVHQYQRRLGFGVLKDPIYFVMRPVQNGWDLGGAASATLRGSGLIVPYWFLTSLFGLIGVISYCRRAQQFGLRTMMLIVTAIVISMGVARWAAD